jgi:hypothetical protein
MENKTPNQEQQDPRWDRLKQKFESYSKFVTVLIVIMVLVTVIGAANESSTFLMILNPILGFVFLVSWPVWLKEVSKELTLK